jgi:hypothetical protein
MTEQHDELTDDVRKQFDTVRRQLCESINRNPKPRELLEVLYGEVWDTSQLVQTFEVHGYMAPFAAVTRRTDNVKGSLMFQHTPRYYFSFDPVKTDGEVHG